MKLFIPQIDCLLECEQGKCQSLVIENKAVWCSILNDVAEQLRGNEGKIVLSCNDKIIPLSKNVELISQFIPFDMNQKGLLTKIMNEMQKIAINEQHFVQTTTALSCWEKYLLELSADMVGNIGFSKINLESLIKSAGIEVESTYDNLGEKILDYFELVSVYDSKKLFVLVNLRSYLSEKEMKEFLKNVMVHQYEILLIDSIEHPILDLEKRYIVDADQCILC